MKIDVVINSDLAIREAMKILDKVAEKCLLVVDKNISKQSVSKIKKSLNQKKLYVHNFKANEINKNLNKF